MKRRVLGHERDRRIDLGKFDGAVDGILHELDSGQNRSHSGRQRVKTVLASRPVHDPLELELGELGGESNGLNRLLEIVGDVADNVTEVD